MGTLYIDRRDITLRKDGDTIAFYVNGRKEGITPIKPLKRVVISSHVLIESQLLGKLAEENVTVVFLSGRYSRFRAMLHGRLHNNGILRLRQYERLASPFALTWAKEVIGRKLLEEVVLLKDLLEVRMDKKLLVQNAIASLESIMDSVDNAIDMATLRGLEGGAGGVYFSAYTGLFPEALGFRKRTRRPPQDPVNALLSLTYTLVHYEAVREIELTGLDPVMGFYHSFDYGRESLACDVMEPLRPLADRFVYTLFNNREFTKRDFTQDTDRGGWYLRKSGRKRFYHLYEDWCEDVRGELSALVRELAKRIMKDGKDPVHK